MKTRFSASAETSYVLYIIAIHAYSFLQHSVLDTWSHSSKTAQHHRFVHKLLQYSTGLFPSRLGRSSWYLTAHVSSCQLNISRTADVVKLDCAVALSCVCWSVACAKRVMHSPYSFTFRRVHSCTRINITRNSTVTDKPRDAFVQMQRRGWPKTRPFKNIEKKLWIHFWVPYFWSWRHQRQTFKVKCQQITRSRWDTS